MQPSSPPQPDYNIPQMQHQNFSPQTLMPSPSVPAYFPSQQQPLYQPYTTYQESHSPLLTIEDITLNSDLPGGFNSPGSTAFRRMPLQIPNSEYGDVQFRPLPYVDSTSRREMRDRDNRDSVLNTRLNFSPDRILPQKQVPQKPSYPEAVRRFVSEDVSFRGRDRPKFSINAPQQSWIQPSSLNTQTQAQLPLVKRAPLNPLDTKFDSLPIDGSWRNSVTADQERATVKGNLRNPIY